MRIAILAALIALSQPALGATMSRAQILERAKVCARDFCKGSSEGCEFQAKKQDGSWAVTASPIYRTESGERGYPLHAECTYYFTSEGTLTREFQYPGLTVGCGGRSSLSSCAR